MGNVGKPTHLPAGKARASEEWRVEQDNIKRTENVFSGPDPNQSLTGRESEPVLRGGQRPAVPSRMDAAVEENDDLLEARQNFYREKTREKDAFDE